MITTVFTLGYEKTTIEDFTVQLKKAKVTILIDVRERAWSRKKDFCKTKFSNYLSQKGIAYIHLPRAGNPSSIRKSSKNAKSVLQKYNRFIKKNQDGVNQILEHIQNVKNKREIFCLTCVEKDYTVCHRSILTDHIIAKRKSIRIKHL